MVLKLFQSALMHIEPGPMNTLKTFSAGRQSWLKRNKSIDQRPENFESIRLQNRADWPHATNVSMFLNRMPSDPTAHSGSKQSALIRPWRTIVSLTGHFWGECGRGDAEMYSQPTYKIKYEPPAQPAWRLWMSRHQKCLYRYRYC